MIQTSTKRRNTIIAAVIVVVLVASSIGAVFYLLTYDNVTVSGQAWSGFWFSPMSTIQKIEFQDTQTGALTAFHFTFTSSGSHDVGNYSVTLKNRHTYNVFITYFVGGSADNPQTDFVTTFTVNETAGQTTITKDF